MRGDLLDSGWKVGEQERQLFRYASLAYSYITIFNVTVPVTMSSIFIICIYKHCEEILYIYI